MESWAGPGYEARTLHEKRVRRIVVLLLLSVCGEEVDEEEEDNIVCLHACTNILFVHYMKQLAVLFDVQMCSLSPLHRPRPPDR